MDTTMDADASTAGLNFRVTACSTQGGRKHMEDMLCVAYQLPTSDDEKELLYAYFGVFDGHGGREAALYAKTHLMNHIVSQKNFWSDDDTLVLRAIKDGFASVHQAMWRELDTWPKTKSGLPATSGTTASVAFARRGKLYIGHAGDSRIVLGYKERQEPLWKAKSLTVDHKPENPAEKNRIQACGGKVVERPGVPRVVWNRPRTGHTGPIRRSTLIDEIPFLAVARSLGDFWSYNSELDAFVVSPVPDTTVLDIDVNTHRCLILASDGLWNVLTCQEAVHSAFLAEKNNRIPQVLAELAADSGPPQSRPHMNPSKMLVDRAINRWRTANLRADNISVITVVIDPPCPPKQAMVPPNPNESMASDGRGCSPVASSSGALTTTRPVSPSRLHRPKETTRFGNERPSHPCPSQSSSVVHSESDLGSSTSPHRPSAPGKVIASRTRIVVPKPNESRSGLRENFIRRKAASIAAVSIRRVYVRNQQIAEVQKVSQQQTVSHQQNTPVSDLSSTRQQQQQQESSSTRLLTCGVQSHDISSSRESGKSNESDVVSETNKKSTRSKQQEFTLNDSPVQEGRKRSARQSDKAESNESEELSLPRKKPKAPNQSEKQGNQTTGGALEQRGPDILGQSERKLAKPVQPTTVRRGEGLSLDKKQTETKENGQKKALKVQTRSLKTIPVPLNVKEEPPYSVTDDDDKDDQDEEEEDDDGETSNLSASSTPKLQTTLDLSAVRLIELSPENVTKIIDPPSRPQKGTGKSSDSNRMESQTISSRKVPGVSNQAIKLKDPVVSLGEKESARVTRIVSVPSLRDQSSPQKQSVVKVLSKKEKSQRKVQISAQKKAVKKGGAGGSGANKTGTSEERKGDERSLRSATQSTRRVTRSMKK